MLEFRDATDIAAEEQLVERVRAGDRSAANTLFERHARACYQAAYRILRNREEAEDAAQDGMLLAYRHFSSFQGRAPFRSWVRRIVMNAAFSRLRACANRSPVPFDELPATERSHAAAADFDPYEQAVRAETRRLVLGRLPGLPLPAGCRKETIPRGFDPQAGAGPLAPYLFAGAESGPRRQAPYQQIAASIGKQQGPSLGTGQAAGTGLACLILVLYYFYGYRTREIAGRLGLPDSTVRARMFRARRLVRSRLSGAAWLTLAPGKGYK